MGHVFFFPGGGGCYIYIHHTSLREFFFSDFPTAERSPSFPFVLEVCVLTVEVELGTPKKKKTATILKGKNQRFRKKNLN